MFITSVIPNDQCYGYTTTVLKLMMVSQEFAVLHLQFQVFPIPEGNMSLLRMVTHVFAELKTSFKKHIPIFIVILLGVSEMSSRSKCRK